MFLFDYAVGRGGRRLFTHLLIPVLVVFPARTLVPLHFLGGWRPFTHRRVPDLVGLPCRIFPALHGLGCLGALRVI